MDSFCIMESASDTDSSHSSKSENNWEKPKTNKVDFSNLAKKVSKEY